MTVKVNSICFLALVVILGSGLTAASAQASEGYSWTISVNGGQPTQLVYTVSGDKVTGQIFGEAIEGFQVGRHLVFYRKSAARQIYHAWMSPNLRSIAGYFSHQGDNLGIWNGTRN